MKKWKSLLLIGILFVISSFASIPNAYGTAYTNTIQLNGEWHDGRFDSREDVVLYHFSLPQSGRLKIEYQSFGPDDWSEWQILNREMTRQYTYSCLMGGPTNPGNDKKEVMLEAGDYTIKVASFDRRSYHVSFRLRGTFQPANVNEIEPNNLFTQAMNITPASNIIGALTEDDSDDFYKFTVSYKTRIAITLTRLLGCNDFYLYDVDYKQIGGNCLGKGVDPWGSEESPHVYKYTQMLEKGTYYIKISKLEGCTGRYYLSYAEETPVTSIQISGKNKLKPKQGTQLQATVYPFSATNKEVIWSSSDNDAFKVNANGYVTTKRTGVATITATSKDNEEIKAYYPIIVLPKKMGKPHLSQISNVLGKKTLAVYWDGNGSHGYQVQYSRKKSMKGARSCYISNNYNRNYCYISPYKKLSFYYYNTVKTKVSKGNYYVRIRGYVTYDGKKYYGAWGNKKKFRMK